MSDRAIHTFYLECTSVYHFAEEKLKSVDTTVIDVYIMLVKQ